jgi:hypothetical protein
MEKWPRTALLALISLFRRDACWALFGLDFRLLLESGLGNLAAFHMAELRLAHPFQFGSRLFQLGFLLAKVGF